MEDIMIIKIILIEFILKIELDCKGWLEFKSLIQLIDEWRHRLFGTLVGKRQKKTKEREVRYFYHF